MCAIFGIAGDPAAAHVTHTGLYALQHRGQESVGIMTADVSGYNILRRRGLVSAINDISALTGYAAIGHTRYSTTGGDTEANIQPLHMKGSMGWVGLAHNGNLVNSSDLTKLLEGQGSIFQTTTDTEVIMHLIAKCRGMDLLDAVVCALRQVDGAYSLLVLNENYLIAIRDPYGFRPLVMGTYDGFPVFASETCAFELIGGTVDREVNPGEMVVVDLKTLKTTTKQVFPPADVRSRCVFEMIYFSRPDSLTFGKSVYTTRCDLGRQLAVEQPADADLVVPVPDSGIAAAIGYANESGIPFEMGIIRSHYMRTFIQPDQRMRDLGVRLKLSPVRAIMEGKRVVVVDDSLVRGTTSKKIIKMIRDAGASEVHFRVSSPPTISTCHYGVDLPYKDGLIATKMTMADLKNYIEADSLGYLSLRGLKSVVGDGFCNACFSDIHPPLVTIGKLRRN